jgi:hypothetical protein
LARLEILLTANIFSVIKNLDELDGDARARRTNRTGEMERTTGTRPRETLGQRAK